MKNVPPTAMPTMDPVLRGVPSSSRGDDLFDADAIGAAETCVPEIFSIGKTSIASRSIIAKLHTQQSPRQTRAQNPLSARY